MKTKKGKGVGKKTKKENLSDGYDKKNETIEIKNLNDANEVNENKEMKGEECSDGKDNLNKDRNKPKILQNLLVVTCDSCHRLAVKHKSLLCSSCQKSYHPQCIPNKHQEHIPDQDELSDFICHKCYLLHDDSELSEDESTQEDIGIF
ncbi:unnamed protein product [Diatraea saccharalis]|uniref:Zinc finger PHD-type domain-containing protein n=1 Tax=Diatraea saccharalis TaxID=40085 RepID=A0A9N9N471_9NEOP|nr:unnamed protein product [Diatraea saccharalis]